MRYASLVQTGGRFGFRDKDRGKDLAIEQVLRLSLGWRGGEGEKHLFLEGSGI